jgi:hypothetical protein
MRPPERDAVGALIERVVARARIPGRSRRDDLRRELMAHFEDACPTPADLDAALRRFGPEWAVAESLRRVYRLDFLLLHAARIAAAIAASLAAAFVIQIIVNVRLDVHADVWRLAAPGFFRSAGTSAALVLGLVTVSEMSRRPFSVERAMYAIGAYVTMWAVAWLLLGVGIGASVTPTLLVILGWLGSRLASRFERTLLMFGAFATVLYTSHLMLGVALAPSRTVVAGAALVLIWSSTTDILRRLDHLFESLVAPGFRTCVSA